MRNAASDELFCQADSRYDILGTRGRVCNSSSAEPDDCRRMCCGRGFVTHHHYAMEPCNCKFVWCCEVKCQQCLVLKTEETCI
ncbi:unnamed protein product [Protopolystoma xenopodis]|uniref:Protein Wnt n=1 Tax=Protopolystoma xenopodis TaxID=117903 RepID=A0A3S5B765_9PLAT|nr:unnamed protein product [Protopolystoma xenopodis]